MDDELLAGVPDEIAPGDDELLFGDVASEDEAAREASEEAAADAAAEAAEREAYRAGRRAMKEADAGEVGGEEAGAPAGGAKRLSGKRKVIEYTLGTGVIVGVDPNDEEERSKRVARAAKFGVPVVADTNAEEEHAKRAARAAKFGAPAANPQASTEPVLPCLVDANELAVRNARAKKWGMEPVDPLAAVEKSAPKDAFWSARRDAAPDEVSRPEAVYVFGTDRMSSDDLLLFFIHSGVQPKHVEWIDDSSANVVFLDEEQAAAAVSARTVPLLENAEGFDCRTWRTIPPSLAHAGKGLQLLFRMATTSDVKPARRGVSRWYGEHASRSGLNDGKSGRASRREAAAPYAKGKAANRTLAETISAVGFALAMYCSFIVARLLFHAHNLCREASISKRKASTALQHTRLPQISIDTPTGITSPYTIASTHLPNQLSGSLGTIFSCAPRPTAVFPASFLLALGNQGKTLADIIADSTQGQEARDERLTNPGISRPVIGASNKSDLRAKLAARKEKAVKHEAGDLPDLRQSLRSNGGADSNRSRVDRAPAEEEDDDEGGEPFSHFSYAAVKAELASGDAEAFDDVVDAIFDADL